MRVKDQPWVTGSASRLNTFGFGEVIMGFDGEEGGMDSMMIRDLEVEVNGEWIYMPVAFREKKIITDNHNEHFGLPENQEAFERGYNW